MTTYHEGQRVQPPLPVPWPGACWFPLCCSFDLLQQWSLQSRDKTSLTGTSSQAHWLAFCCPSQSWFHSHRHSLDVPLTGGPLQRHTAWHPSWWLLVPRTPNLERMPCCWSWCSKRADVEAVGVDGVVDGVVQRIVLHLGRIGIYL